MYLTSIRIYLDILANYDTITKRFYTKSTLYQYIKINQVLNRCCGRNVKKFCK